jgi:hypothetical protein
VRLLSAVDDSRAIQLCVGCYQRQYLPLVAELAGESYFEAAAASPRTGG